MTGSTHIMSTRAPYAQLLHRVRAGSHLLWVSAVVMAMLAIACVGLQQFDGRMVGDANTWHKPAKFFFSIAVHFATVSFAASLLPELERVSRRVQAAISLLAFSGWGEMGYIVFRAARAEASHFNTTTLSAQIGYQLMGLGAVTMTATTFYVGWRLWKHRRDGLLSESVAIGLMLGAFLGTLAGGYMSSQTGHGVGTMAAGSSVGFFGWSTVGGDLRIAHFVGLHALQIVPLAALSGRRPAVYAVTAIVTGLTLATFLQAVSGMPFLRG